MSSELELIKIILHANHIFVNKSWLHKCHEYLSTSHGNSHNLKEISRKVIEQWLLNDLTETSPGCLPQNLNDNTSELKGVYTLQINTIWNFDFYVNYCLNKIKRSKEEINSAGQHDLGNRNLLLVMTDGVQPIYGHVLEPIKDLWINTVPGCKMRIKGPVHLRKHESSDLLFLILNDGNCELLGGEVDTRMKNSYDDTLKQMILLKIQSVTHRHNGYVGQPSEQLAEVDKRKRSSERSVGSGNKRQKIESVNDSVTHRHNGYVGQPSEQLAEVDKRKRSSERSVGSGNKRQKIESVNDSVTHRHNGYVGQPSEQLAEVDKRKRSSERSVGSGNKRQKIESVNDIVIDLT
ncbi:unnamed protein product, partial [Brenthis ino]